MQGANRATAAAFGLSGNAAQEASTVFTSLGRQIFQTQEEAKRFRGVFRSLDGRLCEANGRFVKGREAVEDWSRSVNKASSGTGILTRSVWGLGGTLGALSIAAVTHQVGRLGVESVQAAGQMEQLRRATEQIQGAAVERTGKLWEHSGWITVEVCESQVKNWYMSLLYLLLSVLQLPYTVVVGFLKARVPPAYICRIYLC